MPLRVTRGSSSGFERLADGARVPAQNRQMIKEAVVHGAGISIMPKRVMREDLAHGRLVALPLRPAELYRPVRIVHRRRKVFSEVTAGLLALLREEIVANERRAAPPRRTID
jgi:DNA-binding transcriptional LysR family regulator